MKRTYTGSIIAMLLASRVVAKNFSDDIANLLTVRTNWNADYALALIKTADDVATNVLGKNSKKALFEATDKLNEITIPARRDVSELKVQIDTDFKAEPSKYKIMLSDLGYTTYFNKIHNRSQVAIIGLLTNYKKNIGLYKADMVAQGTPPDLIDRITAYADVVTTANTIQEQLKTSGKNITVNSTQELNTLYKDIIKICKIASKHYINDPVKKEMFTFTKIIKNLGLPKAKKEKPKKEKAKNTIKENTAKV